MFRFFKINLIFIGVLGSFFLLKQQVSAVAPDIRIIIQDDGVNIDAPSGAYVEWKDSFLGDANKRNKRWVTNSEYIIDYTIYGYKFPSMQDEWAQVAKQYCGKNWSRNGEFCDDWGGFRDQLLNSNIIFTQAEWYNSRDKGNCELKDMRTAGQGTCHTDCNAVCTNGCTTDPNDPNTWICRGRDYCDECRGFYGWSPEHGFGCMDNTHNITFDIPDCTCSSCNCVGTTCSWVNNSCQFDIENNNAGVIDMFVGCDCNINHTPSVSVNAPDSCSTSADVVATVTDSDGVADINTIQLDITGATTKSYTISNVGGSDWISPSGTPYTLVKSGNTATATITVNGLLLGSHVATATATDTQNNNGYGNDVFEVAQGATGSIQFTDSSIKIGEEAELTWSTSNATSCQMVCNLFEGLGNSPGCVSGPIACTGALGGITPTSPPFNENQSYNVTLNFSNAVCPGGSDDAVLTIEQSASPWMMTSWGDTYAWEGYSITMQGADESLSPFGMDYDGDPEEYFSNYILSWGPGGGNTCPVYWSLYDYTDANRNRWYDGSSLYQKMIEQAARNGYDSLISDSITNALGGDGAFIATDSQIDSTDECTGNSVIFVNGNLTINPGGLTDSIQDKACVFVVNGNINVSAAGTPTEIGTYDVINGFFLATGSFNVADDSDEGLKINGGVITGLEGFGRDVIENADRPAEAIRYDPRYFELLRDILGQDYPYSVREKGYTD